MPRPGPRPYECARRAWHSERHQPMRGLVIQQIFRLVHDNHCVATKKNKEWQEKLPIVVFKAEEIMYSKANSEAEYSNIETLWDRVNDAVDTIIRKDESTETGELLPPCVEAALNLGCVPIRASRSQRLNNPRTYLRPSYQECSDMSPKFRSEDANERNLELMPARMPHSSMLRMLANVDSPHSGWKSNKITLNANQHIPFQYENFEVDRSASLNRGLVYPLYYGTSFGPEVSGFHLEEPKTSGSVIVGVPVFSSISEPVGRRLQNLFPYREGKNVAKQTSEAAVKDKNKGKEPEIGFDLSLRLGLFSDSGSSREKGCGYVTDIVGDRASHGEVLPKEKRFSFFPVGSADRTKWSVENESTNSELVSRKRKLANDGFFWSSNHFAGL